ncbi:MAG: hypothetical protein PHW83_12135 [Bacteroidales bacterium]|nr:hypothetical protein [Bacteroidales bacterium]
MMTEDRMRLLLDKAADLRSLADSLDMAAALLKGSKPQDLPAIDEEQEEASDKGREPSPSLTDVRAILADKSRDGHSGQIRALLQKYGAPRLSEVDPVHYRDLLDEALCLGASKADIEAAMAEKEREGFKDTFVAVFEHHGATCLEDLKAEYYPSFLRDIRRLGNG